MLFADYYDDWIETYKRDTVAEVTFEKYEVTARWIRELAPDLKMQDLSRSSFQKIINAYGKCHEKTTVLDFLHQIGASLDDAMEDKILDRNPRIRIQIACLPPKKRKDKFLEKDELAKIIELMDLTGYDQSSDKFLYVIAKTGMRFAEALAVQVKNVDLDNLKLHVENTWNYKEVNGFFMPTKNASSVRTISIDYKTARVLERLMRDRDPEDLVFIDKNRRVFNSTFNMHLTALCKEAGVPVISIHGLRHTHASILFADKVPITVVSKRLGHSSVSTTQSTYVHLLRSTEKEAEGQIANLMMTL
jgi:integrase